MPYNKIHPFYVLKHLGIHLNITPLRKNRLKLELDLSSTDFTIEEAHKIIKALYKDYIISDIETSEFDDAK